MNRFVTSSLGAIFLTAALAGTSHAAMPSSSMSPVDRALAADHNPRFVIETLDEIEKHDMKSDYLGSLSPSSPEARGLQTAIAENKVLRKELLSQDVDLKNLIYADEADDGSFILYMR
ncbi:hypothetical protein [Rhizobium oryzicola]|uniref:Secreted protein n=1 Tax=Rhizobium oryzicola TaxID=1232668 RepID=A0ABT8STK5_9HYPH|nr:hypothetical protein [Rhizobium oryzicola]MDO1581769.1 hypothetical protein [Rhizobium oryzicola]